MKKVYCFWLDEEVPVHDASAVFNPLNGVCWDCRACIGAMERRGEDEPQSRPNKSYPQKAQ